MHRPKLIFTLSLLGLMAFEGKSLAQEAGFQSTPSGLEYRFLTDEPGDRNPGPGDMIEVHIHASVDTTVIFDSRKLNNNEPVMFPYAPPQYPGDLSEGIEKMTAGDKAHFLLSVDSMVSAGVPKQPWMTLGIGQKVLYKVDMVSIKNIEAMEKEQKAADDKILQEYFKKENIKPTKTESGLYYTLKTEGSGAKPQPGSKVTVNYTGKFLDGTPFDSNVDPQFQHVEPFVFQLGQGMVIKGWDEGIGYLSKGQKGELYIPSHLAYGPNGQGPIKPNSILIFEVELVDFE